LTFSLYDSQNNNNGGYQVGDDCSPYPCQNNNEQYNSSAPGAGLGIMQFYERSQLRIEW